MLEGVKIVEMATYIAAPAASGVMADWGADVIKIEPLGGCPMRQFYAAAMSDDYPDNPVFDIDNRGKRGIALNTSEPSGAEIVRKLAKHADIFLTNLRPTQLEKQKLDFAELKKINPKLVYASVTGFGLRGDEKDKPGFDTAAFWAKSGIGWLMTPKDAAPAPLRVAVGDHVTALATAAGILAALLRARATGEGELVESSLIRSGIYALGSDMGTFLRYGRIARSRQREAPVVPANNFYQTKDGHWLFLNARPGEPDWPDILRALDLEKLADDSRFASLRDRRRNARELVALMDAAFQTADLATWKKRLDAAGLIWSPVQNLEQVRDDPQMQAAGAFVDVPKTDGGSYKGVASPIRFHHDTTDPRGPAPALGEHSAQILDELGLDEGEIAALIEGGITKQA